MISQKTVHFYGNVLRTRPFDLPGMVARRVREAVSRRPSGVATTRFGAVAFPVDTDLHAIARKYYFRTHEMFLETIFRRHLRPGSVFVDVGANMGYWSAFAAALVGPSGEVHAFEPVPAFFRSLERLRDANPSLTIRANRMACGAGPGVVPMAVVRPASENFDNFDTNIGSSSALPGFLDHDIGLTETIDVPVVGLDDHLDAAGVDIERIGLIKIDVEGFESYCFDGMPRLLGKSGRKVPILCEVLTDPARHPLLDGPKIVARLERHGYRCLDATTLAPIDPTAMMFEENILCVGAE